jgi:arylsulfatase A-like enzyme
LNGIVTLKDIVPTILDYTGKSDLIEREKIEGKSLRTIIESNSHQGTTGAVYLTECGWMKKRGWQTSSWKLILETGDTPEVYNTPDIELYNLDDDPEELYNLAEDSPQKVKELKAEMEDFLAQRLANTGLPDPTIQQDITMRRLGNKELAAPRNLNS